MTAATPTPARAIQPFWLRLRSIAAYPFRGEALATLALLSLGQLLGFLPALGWLLLLLLLGMAYKYAFTILRETAHGRLDPPGGVLETPDGVIWKFLVMQVVFVAALVLIAGVLGAGAAILAMVALVIAQPGATMALAMDESLGHALNPATWLTLIVRIGWPYLALVGLLFVFQYSAVNAKNLLAGILPELLANVVLHAVFLWGLFATFHLMGYLLYQYHEALGYEPEADAHAQHRPEGRDSALLAEAGALLQDGQADAALALLRDEVRTRAVSLDLHDLYRRILQQLGHRTELVAHGRELLHLLLLEGKPQQTRRALGVARECLDIDPDFTPPLAEQGLLLAERAAAMGQSALALDLLTALRRAHPKHADRAQWALIEAGLLIDKFGRDEDARALLGEARERCEDAALRARIDALLAALPAEG